jgi:hypothetical protein
MKSNDFYHLMINPFSRIAGWKAFAIGLVVVVLSAVIGKYSLVCFDGTLDIHLAQKLTLGGALGMQLISTFILVLVMCIAGMIVSKGFRFVDILGTMTFARVPLLITALIGFFVHMPDPNVIIANPLSLLLPSSILFALLTIVVVVWYITLVVNAMKVSCDIKGGKLAVTIIIGLLVSEIISKSLIYFVL